MSARTSRAPQLWALLGLALLAANLRAAITSVPPLLGALQDVLGLSGAQVGILTTLPVLCLGAFAAVAPAVAHRIGTEAAVALALAVLTLGVALRAVPVPLCLFAGTVLAGAGIAVGNVLVPAVVKRHFPARTGAATGIAMTLMAGSGALAAALAVPVHDAAGWRPALALWALPALPAVLVWRRLARRARRAGAAVRAVPAERGRSLLAAPLAWAVAGFLGVVSLMFYVLVSWLPAVMRDSGYGAAEAGLMMSVMLAIGIPLGFVVPVVAARLSDQRPLVAGIAALKVTGMAGLLLDPGSAWVWVVVLGVATGSAFPLAITLLGLRSPDPVTAARLSGLAQTFGYLVAGTGPVAIGMLHDATGDWDRPLLVLMALAVPGTWCGLRAARPGYVGTGRPRTPVAQAVPVVPGPRSGGGRTPTPVGSPERGAGVRPSSRS
ncbi:MFS transporter [Streptomyces sp. NPDC089919]|uniref:MFS transporter n=1 Tax=Streptomyces sp. NPDC089919 TaxID=3155188 RepID=UPI00343C8FFC